MSTSANVMASPATADLLDAVRSLFTCTRKVRGWASDTGAVTVLSAVAALGESRVSAVAAALHMDVSTVSRSLSALTREGLVDQRPDPADARSHLVRCSETGAALLDERRQQFADELERRLADWPADDVADLSRLLHRFVASVLADPHSASTASSATPPSNQKEIA